MKKIFVYSLLFAVCSLPGQNAQGQLLYRVQGNGLKAPSYVIGTYHLAPVTFVDSIPGLHEALDNCEQVYGELDMQDMMKKENMDKLQQAQMLPEGKRLRELFDKDQLGRLNALMRDVMGVDLDNDAVAKQLDQVSPAALSATLTMMVCMKKTPGFNPADLFDGWFQKMALAANKPVKGFETVEFQAKVLYDTPLEQQVEDLMCMVDNFMDVQEMVDFITAAFFAQDLDQLGELFAEEMEGPCSGNPEENAKLIDNRNAEWLKQMPTIMKEKPTFFAVGAGHLVGPQGLLEQLRQMGYEVEGVRK